MALGQELALDTNWLRIWLHNGNYPAQVVCCLLPPARSNVWRTAERGGLFGQDLSVIEPQDRTHQQVPCLCRMSVPPLALRARGVARLFKRATPGPCACRMLS